jgi:hypothetical protein
MREIVMIHPPLQCDVLTNTDYHILRRCHIHHRGLAGVRIRDPDRDREAVCCPPEDRRQRAHKVEEKGREAILVGLGVEFVRMHSQSWNWMSLTIDIGTRGERGVLSKRIDNIVIGSIRVVVGLFGVVVILIKH